MRRLTSWLTALAVIGTAAIVADPAVHPAAAAVPSGFTDQAVADIPSPTAVEPLPDGRVVVLGQSGAVWLLSGGTVLPGPAIDLDVCSTGERGLLGFAADAAFGANGFVYMFYTRRLDTAAGGCVNRVSRFTMTGNTISPASETVLLDLISARGGNHNAGDLEVGADGYLYVTTGDAGVDPRTGASPSNAAQDLALLNGKILRIVPQTGAPAPGNPFTGQGSAVCAQRGNTAATPPSLTSKCQEIFAVGLRNPYRFAFDPNSPSTRFFVNDVGQSTREEIDLGALGANYGWPEREGVCPRGQNPPCAATPAGYTDPLYDYPRAVGEYITGGAFVPAGIWPGAYEGGYLFADGGAGAIFLRTAAGTVNTAAPFATDVGEVAHLAFGSGPGGAALYYTQARTTTGSVHRITYPLPDPPASGALTYVPHAVADRVLDSREAGLGGPDPLRAGTTRTLALGRSSPVPAGAQAALVSIAAVGPEANGFVTAWGAGTAMPGTANLNFFAGDVVANTSIVPATGDLSVFSLATTHLVIDVLGFFVPAPSAVAAGRVEPVTPTRLLDTRQPAGPGNDYRETPREAGTTATVPIVAPGSAVPAGAAAAVISIAAIYAEPSGGFVTAYPAGGAYPPTANVNLSHAGDVRANLAIVPLGSGAAIDVRMAYVDDVVVDVVGYVTGAGAPAAGRGRLHLVAPRREVDTRIGLGFGPLPGDATATVNPLSVPDTAGALVLNAAIVEPAGPTFLTAYMAGLPRPATSTVNATGAGQVRSSLAISGLGSGAMSVYSLAPTHAVLDVTGWFEG